MQTTSGSYKYGEECLGGCGKLVLNRTRTCKNCRKKKCKSCGKEFSLNTVQPNSYECFDCRSYSKLEKVISRSGMV